MGRHVQSPNVIGEIDLSELDHLRDRDPNALLQTVTGHIAYIATAVEILREKKKFKKGVSRDTALRAIDETMRFDQRMEIITGKRERITKTAHKEMMEELREKGKERDQLEIQPVTYELPQDPTAEPNDHLDKLSGITKGGWWSWLWGWPSEKESIISDIRHRWIWYAKAFVAGAGVGWTARIYLWPLLSG